MENIWLNQYVAGTPQTISTEKYSSIWSLLSTSMKQYADHYALESLGSKLTYSQLDKYSLAIAAFLQNNLGLIKGDRVALMMPNIFQYSIVLFACLRSGLIVVNVNPMYTSSELKKQLQDSGAKAIFIFENFLHVLAEIEKKVEIKHCITVSIGDLLGKIKGLLINFYLRYIKKAVKKSHLKINTMKFKHILDLGMQLPFNEPYLNKQDTAFLQYTGGTTGVFKAAVLTQNNITANILQAHAWIKSKMKCGEEIIITALPMYHIFSLTANCLTFAYLGGLNILIADPRDLHSFVKTLARHKFTAITGVNTLFSKLMEQPNLSKIDFSALKLTLSGGMKLYKVVADKWKKITGCIALEAYGLTETSPAVCINPVNEKEYNGTVGLPISSTEVAILDENENELDINQVGELVVKGPQVMSKYWNKGDETKKAFTKNGYFKTGDLALVNERGYVTIVDRKKEMIIVSGFNVYPNEIENLVLTIPGIIEVAAVGVNDDKTGEAIKLYVVTNGKIISKEDIIAVCRKNLTGYKVPRQIEFRKSLPKSTVGKVLKREL